MTILRDYQELNEMDSADFKKT